METLRLVTKPAVTADFTLLLCLGQYSFMFVNTPNQFFIFVYILLILRHVVVLPSYEHLDIAFLFIF